MRCAREQRALPEPRPERDPRRPRQQLARRRIRGFAAPAGPRPARRTSKSRSPTNSASRAAATVAGAVRVAADGERLVRVDLEGPGVLLEQAPGIRSRGPAPSACESTAAPSRLRKP